MGYSKEPDSGSQIHPDAKPPHGHPNKHQLVPRTQLNLLLNNGNRQRKKSSQKNGASPKNTAHNRHSKKDINLSMKKKGRDLSFTKANPGNILSPKANTTIQSKRSSYKSSKTHSFMMTQGSVNNGNAQIT
jgi:hypothetical protein